MYDHPMYKNEILERWKHAAIYYVMITGKNNGKVRNIPGFNDPLVRCKVSTEELVNLGKGMRQLSHLLFKAGANFIYPSIFGMDRLCSADDISMIPVPLERNKSNLMTIHLTSSCPMGENQNICATNSFGKVWNTENLYVNDASLLCTSTLSKSPRQCNGYSLQKCYEFCFKINDCKVSNRSQWMAWLQSDECSSKRW